MACWGPFCRGRLAGILIFHSKFTTFFLSIIKRFRLILILSEYQIQIHWARFVSQNISFGKYFNCHLIVHILKRAAFCMIQSMYSKCVGNKPKKGLIQEWRTFVKWIPGGRKHMISWRCKLLTTPPKTAADISCTISWHPGFHFMWVCRPSQVITYGHRSWNCLKSAFFHWRYQIFVYASHSHCTFGFSICVYN